MFGGGAFGELMFGGLPSDFGTTTGPFPFFLDNFMTGRMLRQFTGGMSKI